MVWKEVSGGARKAGRSEGFEALVGKDEFLVAERLRLGLFAAGHAQHQLVDLAADFVAAHHDGAPPIDVFPTDTSALVGAGDPEHAIADDFNCLDRPDAAPDAGAYGWMAGGNPGWTLTADFKDCAAGGDGGSTGDDGDTGNDSGADETGADTADATGVSASASATAGVDATAGDDDMGTSDDAGADDLSDDGEAGGCNCRTSTPGPSGALVLLLLARLRRRKR